MGIRTFVSRFLHPQITRLAIVTLIALACRTPAFCGEIHDAAKAGDLAKIKTCSKKIPGWLPARIDLT
jgi:hypothetical protein